MTNSHFVLAVLGAYCLSHARAQVTEPIFPVSCVLNVLFVLDRSDSVKGGFNKSREFVLEVSRELRISPDQHRVALVVYSGNHYRREVFKWNFAKNNAEFVRIVSGLRAIGGTTNTEKALQVSLDLMETRDKDIPTIVMVVTDGRSFVDPAEPAKRLRNIPNTWMFAAATGDPQLVDRRELLQISGHINRVILQTGRELASTIARRLLREAQEKCQTTTTTTTTTTNPFTGCEQDLVLVMDFSTTTSRIYMQYEELAERLLRQLYISPRHTRVALVIFSSQRRTYTRFDLNHFDNADAVIKAIKSTQYMGGLTALGSGLEEAIKEADERRGARPKLANKIMVVFTDGWVNDGPDPEEPARKAVAAGFRVLSVGIDAYRPPESIRLRKQTLNSIVSNERDSFTDANYADLIKIVRERNLKCL
ncbi:Protein C18H7.1 [Aphelenchoides avenae]|nr:Protein C18H7.1 [Aphelenchus avenae]